jgi:hypothetical protein
MKCTTKVPFRLTAGKRTPMDACDVTTVEVLAQVMALQTLPSNSDGKNNISMDHYHGLTNFI